MDPICVAEVSGLVLHEAELPATYGMWLCDCAGCCIALQATGMQFPDTAVCLDFSCGTRRVLHWTEYRDAHEAHRSGADPDAFLRFSDHWTDDECVREVFVVRGTAAPHCDCDELDDVPCPRRGERR